MANGSLALLQLSGSSLNVADHRTSCLPLKTLFPHLQHLHTQNGYRLNYDPFPGFDLLDEISQLPLLTLTYSTYHTRQPSHTASNFHTVSSLHIAIRSTLASAGIQIETLHWSSAPLELPRASESTATASSSAPEVKKKKDKAKGGRIFSRIFRKAEDPPKPVEKPISVASSSEPTSSSSTHIFREPEDHKTKYKPQLDFATITSLVSSSDIRFTPASDSATSTDNGYAEFWARTMMDREEAVNTKDLLNKANR